MRYFSIILGVGELFLRITENGYISLRKLEDQCKVNLRFMYLMDHQTPSYRTFGYFINEVLADSIEDIFQDINKKIFETEHVDLQHLYIDDSKFQQMRINTPGYGKNQQKKAATAA